MPWGQRLTPRLGVFPTPASPLFLNNQIHLFTGPKDETAWSGHNDAYPKFGGLIGDRQAHGGEESGRNQFQLLTNVRDRRRRDLPLQRSGAHLHCGAKFYVR